MYSPEGTREFEFSAKAKWAAAAFSPSVVCVVSRNLPEDMTKYLRGCEYVELKRKAHVEKILKASGWIIDCDDTGHGTYIATILSVATPFVRTNGVQPHEIEVDVIVFDGKILKGKVVACDFHMNLSAIMINSHFPLRAAKWKALDDMEFLDRSFTLGPHSDLLKVVPGEELVSLTRSFIPPFRLGAASGPFSMKPVKKVINEVYQVEGIRTSVFATGGGPIINLSGQVIGMSYGDSTFLPMNIVSRWWAHYKMHRTARRPWVGLEVVNLQDADDFTFMESFVDKFPDSTGVLVTKVFEDSPASSSGLQPLDVIVRCDNHLTRSKLEFYEQIWDKTGENVEFQILRASKDGRFNVVTKIGERTPDNFYKWRNLEWHYRDP